MRRDVRMYADTADLFSRYWRGLVGWGPGARAWTRRRYHKQERQAGKRQARDVD